MIHCEIYREADLPSMFVTGVIFSVLSIVFILISLVDNLFSGPRPWLWSSVVVVVVFTRCPVARGRRLWSLAVVVVVDGRFHQVACRPWTFWAIGDGLCDPTGSV